MTERARLLLYEPNAGGHQSEFLTWLVQEWDEAHGRLMVAAPAKTLSASPLPDALREAPGVRAIELPPPSRGTRDSLSRLDPLRHLAIAHSPDAILSMTFEHLLVALAARRPIGAPLSALTLRPTLHYSTLGSPPTSTREHLGRWAKRTLTTSALRHPSVSTLFSLDPTAVPRLQALSPSTRVLAVHDPVPPMPSSKEDLRAVYGIAPTRMLVLHAGRLDERKGVFVLLDALRQLDPSFHPKLCVLMAGRLHSDVAKEVHQRASQIQRDTDIQLILDTTHIPDDRLAGLTQHADLILLPYQRHVGSSGLLLRAAAAGTPVLCQSFGLLGHLVQAHALGQAVNTSSPVAIAEALRVALESPGVGYDPRSAANFVAGRSVTAFARTMLDALLD